MLWHGTKSLIESCNAFGATRDWQTKRRAKERESCGRTSRALGTSFMALTCGRNDMLAYATKK